MMQLPGLRPLYDDMKKHHQERVVFSYTNNQATLEIIFMIDVQPFVLLIAAHGVRHFALEVSVHQGFMIDAFLGDAYGGLLDALGVESNPANPFSTRAFFEDLNAHVPSTVGRTTAPTPAQVAQRQIDFEEREKVYFLGWVAHDERHVTAANLEKTRKLIGEAAFRHCHRANISSRWSALRHEDKPVTPPPGAGSIA